MSDVALQALPTVAVMAAGDLIPFTSAPGSVPVSKNITKQNLFNALAEGGRTGATPTATAIEAVGDSYQTLVALTADTFGTIHVVATENGTTNSCYYRVDYICGTGIGIQASTPPVGGSLGLTFQLSGANLQARSTGVAPAYVKCYIEFYSTLSGAY
jgi:hypothetical protein